MVAEQLPRQAITRVWASNFRSIERIDLDLGPLTVLVGPNASGKSNVVDIVRFFRDAASKGIELAIAERGGINSVQRQTTEGVTPETELGLHYQGRGGSVEYGLMLAKKSSNGYSIRKENLTLETASGRFPHEALTVQLVEGRPVLSKFFHQPRLDSEETIEYRDGELSSWSDDDDFDDQDLVLLQNRLSAIRGFLPNVRALRENQSSSLAIGRPTRFIFQDFLNHLTQMGFYRLFPNALREPQRMLENRVLSEGGENLASALLDMERTNNQFLPDLKQSLNIVAPGIQDVRVSPAGSYLVVELEHKDSDSSGEVVWFDLSDQSDGTLRLLGLLVAIFQHPPPAILAIEEPEMNIHPGAMAVLMDTIAEATHRSQTLITTHSPELISMVPAESIRAVSRISGVTEVGRVSHYQIQSVMDGLFSAGELHAMEGLRVEGVEE